MTEAYDDTDEAEAGTKVLIKDTEAGDDTPDIHATARLSEAAGCNVLHTWYEERPG